ncbi:protodermal factor 1 [Amaranthus tricolor]|uniref:protodermal factor 1 n=1 Tax=Amaranthus tricolor TaxID=29722 RepID=UPI002582722E|nr:protodermal factor 1 [Amaranthus tricolor]
MGRTKPFFFCLVLVLLSTNNLLLPVASTSGHRGSLQNKNSISQSNCNTPPSGSGGSGGYYPSPKPTPSHGGGGGHHYNPPKHTPTNPPKGGGGCPCGSPPSYSPPPTSGGGGGYYPPTPSTPTPVIVTPPSSPLVPSPPVVPVGPSPPYTPGTPLTPYDPPFPCTYWGSHPTLIFGVLGWWATVGGLWGVTTLPGLSSATSLQQVLTNPTNDGYGSLYREGTAAFLNSMAAKEFPFSTKQVKDSFLASLDSDHAAATQARLFKLANERKFKTTTLSSSNKP